MSQNPAFKIIESKLIPAVRSTVTLAAHVASGAEFIHVHCEEERENFFSVCFRTPPPDDSGVPHIIEHTVLSGSKKYPVKDPFMEMVKSSMATFINALTYGDRTLYPCGSLNERDFKNLVSIYLDAVFHPLLKEEFFLQEGYRLDFEEPGNSNSPLIHNGVVYNEMKGAYTDPDSYIERELTRYLYPDGSCGKDSGGDPHAIPGLSYCQFKKYHEQYYHPSNCCLFTLTKIPFEKMAEFIDERLTGFTVSNATTESIAQPRFKKPVRRETPIPGEIDNLCTITSGWMTNNAGDPVETLAFALLEDVLLDDDSSPVKAALIDSELGTGLSGCGYDSDPEERNFLIGLKGVERKNAQTVFDLIMSTLGKLAEDGLNRKLVENMLHRKELHLRQIGSSWPYSVMSSVCAAWTHGEDVLQSLDLNYLLETLKKRMAENPEFLEDMIREHLIENNHRIDCIFYPDESHFEKEDERVSKELRVTRESMSNEELALLAERSSSLLKSMDSPSTDEQLATLPKLSISDVSTKPPSIFHREEIVGNKLFLPTEIQTAGVCYVDMCFDVSELPIELIPHLSFYAGFLTRTGAGEMNYLEMAEKELGCSGGLSASVSSISSTASSVDEFRLIFKINGHCLAEDLSEMLSVMEKRLFSPNLETAERILTVAGEFTEHGRSSLIPRGHIFASTRAASGLSAGSYANELLHGIPALQKTASIKRDTVENEITVLKTIQKHLSLKSPQILAWAGPTELESTVSNWLNYLPGSKERLHKHLSPIFPSSPVKSGVIIKGGTSFTAAALPGIPLNHILGGSGIVMMRMLSEGFLWDEIRVKKGAYGGGGSLSGNGITFYSYRDPSPASSVEIFKTAIMQGVSKLDLNPRAVEDSIIASVKGIDPAIRPSMANGMAILRHLKEIDIKLIEQHRASLLAVKPNSIREFGDLLSSRISSLSICVLGNEDVLSSMGINNRIKL